MSSKVMLIAGATGLVGQHLVPQARAHGYSVRILTRRQSAAVPPGTQKVVWRSEGNAETSVSQAMSGASVVVNLAGTSIGDGRLSEEHKRKVLESRLQATSTLVHSFEQCPHPPTVWVQASAIGYYGNRGETPVTEQTPPAENWFLADVCKQWEQTAKRVTALPQAPRLIIARIGLVLAKDAPAWKKMLLPIKLGAGGPLGSGKQWFSWIDADDLARALIFLAENAEAHGAYNLTAPEPVRQRDLTKMAAQRLHRPALVPAPAFALRMILGEAADALLLASCKAIPERLEQSGFEFAHRSVNSELDHLLG